MGLKLENNVITEGPVVFPEIFDKVIPNHFHFPLLLSVIGLVQTMYRTNDMKDSTHTPRDKLTELLTS